MKPSVKGYFVYGPYFALIGDIEVHTVLGLRSRRYVAFKIALWSDDYCEATPEFLATTNGEDLWCVELDRSDLSVEQIESYCIYVALNTKLSTSLREPVTRSRSKEATVVINGQKTTAMVTPLHLTERVARDLNTHELIRGDNTCRYRVNAGGNEYDFTLYYKGETGNLAATDLNKGSVFALCLEDLAKRTLT